VTAKPTRKRTTPEILSPNNTDTITSNIGRTNYVLVIIAFLAGFITGVMIPYLIRHIRNSMRGRWTSVIAFRNSSQGTLTVHMQNGEFNDNG
jgi:hypothetical protein